MRLPPLESQQSIDEYDCTAVHDVAEQKDQAEWYLAFYHNFGLGVLPVVGRLFLRGDLCRDAHGIIV